MFEFASPQYLLFLLVLPAVYWRNRRRSMVPFLRVSSVELLSPFSGTAMARVSGLLKFMKYAALVLMIIAAARPRLGTKHENILSEGINIIMALDTSGSMAALDFKQDGKIVDRLTAVKGVMDRFVSGRSGDRVGMVVFGSRAYTQLPLTRDYNTISFMLDRIAIGAAGRQTAIGDAVGISLKRLEDIKSKSNIIILLTDGSSNSGELTPDAAVDIAASRGVKIYTIGVGTRGKAPFLVKGGLFGDRFVYRPVDMDEGTLKMAAEKTGGLYFRAEDTQSLEQIYETIDRLEKTEVLVKTFTEYREYYGMLLIPAFLLVSMYIILTNTRFLRIP